MSSPYSPAQTAGPPQTVTIRDRTRLVLPRVCVVCGAPSDELVQYTQDSAPIILPGIGFVRTAQVSVPYCSGHAAAFRQRFINLRRLQTAAYFIMLIAILAVMPPLNRMIDLPPAMRLACYATAAGCFLFLIATIFVVKPRLYDAFYAISGGRVRIKASLPFLESLSALNKDNVEP
jgi:hypothetical protein